MEEEITVRLGGKFDQLLNSTLDRHIDNMRERKLIQK